MQTRQPASRTQEMNAFGKWYHKIKLPDGTETPGWAPLDPDQYRFDQVDFNGLTVLDVGAWDGYWTFRALDAGASRVVAIDDFSDRLSMSDQYPRDQKWGTFDYCRKALGYSEDVCHRVEMSVYDVADLGEKFDVILFYGTLYHCRHPMLALDRLRAVCKPEGMIRVESAVCDEFSPYRGLGTEHGYPDQMVAEFYPRDEYGNNPTNWWAPTTKCLAFMVGAAGWPRIEVWRAHNVEVTHQARGWAVGGPVIPD